MEKFTDLLGQRRASIAYHLLLFSEFYVSDYTVSLLYFNNHMENPASIMLSLFAELLVLHPSAALENSDQLDIIYTGYCSFLLICLLYGQGSIYFLCSFPTELRHHDYVWYRSTINTYFSNLVALLLSSIIFITFLIPKLKKFSQISLIN